MAGGAIARSTDEHKSRPNEHAPPTGKDSQARDIVPARFFVGFARTGARMGTGGYPDGSEQGTGNREQDK